MPGAAPGALKGLRENAGAPVYRCGEVRRFAEMWFFEARFRRAAVFSGLKFLPVSVFMGVAYARQKRVSVFKGRVCFAFSSQTADKQETVAVVYTGISFRSALLSWGVG
jgi:hypothetical protein